MAISQVELERAVKAYGVFLIQSHAFHGIALEMFPLIEDEAGGVLLPIDQRENKLAQLYAKHFASKHRGWQVQAEVAMIDRERRGVTAIVKLAIYDPEHQAPRPVRDMLWTHFMEQVED